MLDILGSYAMGSFKSDSDIDLFVIGTPDEDDVFNVVQRIEESVSREINFRIDDVTGFAEKAMRMTYSGVS